MKKLLLTAIGCYFFALTFAQTTPQSIVVKGVVIDSAIMQPMGYVTVGIQTITTKAPVKSNLTKDDGTFELKAANGNYELVLAFVGYQTKVLPVTAGKDGIANFGKIYLESSSKQLKGVNITAVKPLMKQEVDRITYDVQADPESKALDALDMMRKVPLLAVDASDNITLKGSGNYKILINGKESALVAKNPADVLRSMPATNIVRIEVITTPPAKYDAEGLAGIINIITTKNADQGYNIGVNTRYSSAWGTGLNLNTTVKEGKFGFSGYFGTNHHPDQTNPTSNTQTFTADNSVLAQKGSSTYGGNHKYASGEFSYEIDSLNLLTASIDFYNGNNKQNGYNNTTTTLDDVILQRYNQNNTGTSGNTGVDAGINYQLGFKKSKDQLLTLSYEYNYSPNSSNTQNDFSDFLNYFQPNFTQYNNEGNKEHTIQVDYAQPFNKKLSMEVGAKAIFRNNYSDFQTDTLVAPNQYNQDQGQTNDFNYLENVYSAYNSYQLKLSKWTAKAGFRLEETTVNADFSSVGTTLKTNYGNLIPSLSIQRNISANSSIDFGFTERIQRPDIDELNPFVNTTNPQFISTGNPDLKPELNHVFQLNYSNFGKGSINFGLDYSFSNNSIQNVSNLQTDTIGGKPATVTTTTYENLGSNKTLDLNINANYSIGTHFTVNVNGEISRVWLKGYYDNNLYTNSGYKSQMFANLGYKFADDYRVGANVGYFSGDVTLQGKASYFLYNSFVISKDLLKKKASISFMIADPYSKYWDSKSYTNTPDYMQTSNNQQIYRSFQIRLNYRFGRLNSDIKKNQHSINNDDVKSGTNNTGNQ
jgi:hypothetical protein